MLKVGIIGYGFMGHVHAKMFEGMKEFKVVAICDLLLRRIYPR